MIQIYYYFITNFNLDKKVEIKKKKIFLLKTTRKFLKFKSKKKKQRKMIN